MRLLGLVVVDQAGVEALFRHQFLRELRTGRFNMDFAQSAAAALQSISDAAGASLILILSDINMPGMSGLEAFRAIPEIEPKLPVLIMTAFGTTETAIDATKMWAYTSGATPSENTQDIMALICPAPRG